MGLVIEIMGAHSANVHVVANACLVLKHLYVSSAESTRGWKSNGVHDVQPVDLATEVVRGFLDCGEDLLEPLHTAVGRFPKQEIITETAAAVLRLLAQAGVE